MVKRLCLKQVLMHFGSGADNIEFNIDNTDNKLVFLSTAWTQKYSTALSANTWYSVIYRVDRSNDSNTGFLINGDNFEAYSGSSITHPTYTNAGTSYMGRDDSTSNMFKGNIDLVYIYKGDLTYDDATGKKGITAIAEGGEWDGRTSSYAGGGTVALSYESNADGKFPTYSWLMGDVRATYQRYNITTEHIYPDAQGPQLWDSGNSRFDIPHNAHGIRDGINNYEYDGYATYPEFILGDSSTHAGNATGPYWRSNGMTQDYIEYDTPDY